MKSAIKSYRGCHFYFESAVRRTWGTWSRSPASWTDLSMQGVKLVGTDAVSSIWGHQNTPLGEIHTGAWFIFEQG